jgi:endonuclease-8
LPPLFFIVIFAVSLYFPLMPEGPEIRRAADKLNRAIGHQIATEVFFAFDHLKTFQDQLSGCTVTAIRPYGKAIVTYFDNGLGVYSHNQLYGKWVTCKPDAVPETNRQLRFAVHTKKKWALLYSASDIEILDHTEVPHHPYIAKLGPEVLAAEVSPDEIRNRTLDQKFRRRQFASLLLDQGFLSGIGNYLRSEILFVSGIHPSLRPMDCGHQKMSTFAAAALDIPRQSYRHNGITNDLDHAAQLKETGHRRRDYRHWVFGRSQQPCYRCGTAIEKVMMGGRRCYICPRCQPEKDA